MIPFVCGESTMKIGSLIFVGLQIVQVGIFEDASATGRTHEVLGISHASSVVKEATCKASAHQFREWANNRDSRLSPLERMAWLDDANGVRSEVSRATLGERASAIKASAMANSTNALKVLAETSAGTSMSAKVDGAATASQCGNVESLQVLLNSGVSPNSVHTSGADLMFISLVNKQFSVSHLLIDRGYKSCEYKGKDGRSAREFAASSGAKKLVARMETCKP